MSGEFQETTCSKRLEACKQKSFDFLKLCVGVGIVAAPVVFYLGGICNIPELHGGEDSCRPSKAGAAALFGFIATEVACVYAVKKLIQCCS